MKWRRGICEKQVPWEDLPYADALQVRIPAWECRGEDPEALYARQEIQERMLQADRSLLPMYQAVCSLARARSCTIQATADELEKSVAAVKARLHRAGKQLREKLNPIGGVTDQTAFLQLRSPGVQ